MTHVKSIYRHFQYNVNPLNDIKVYETLKANIKKSEYIK